MIKLFTFVLIALAAAATPSKDINNLRAPAYPLVSIDPYTNGWSMADKLYGDDVRHWTEKPFPLRGTLTVDGVDYRFMGAGEGNTAEQLYADVQATRTSYGFTCGPVDLVLTFTAPLLMDNLELISRPVNYISYCVTSNDGKRHRASIRFEASPLWAVNTPDQETVSECSRHGRLVYLRAGTKSQNYFSGKGDDMVVVWHIANENDFIGYDVVGVLSPCQQFDDLCVAIGDEFQFVFHHKRSVQVVRVDGDAQEGEKAVLGRNDFVVNLGGTLAVKVEAERGGVAFCQAYGTDFQVVAVLVVDSQFMSGRA